MRVGIVGAGLAGLSCGIRLRFLGVDVDIYDKQNIPTLKVCGEYVSLEVLPLIEKLGIDININSLPFLDTLTTRRESYSSYCHLPLGGIGISREYLDGSFKNKFLKIGGKIYEGISVVEITNHIIKRKDGLVQNYDYVINASGRLNPFANIQKDSRESYVGYKKHVKAKNWQHNRIHLEFFPWGYIGYNLVEDDKICVCTLVKQQRLKELKSISLHESEICISEPLLQSLFNQQSKVVTISNFSFYKYEITNTQTIGDAAGNIPPLVGNGMSLAIVSGNKMATEIANNRYTDFHSQNGRIATAIWLNELALSPLASLGIISINQNEYITQNIISMTHGYPQ